MDMKIPFTLDAWLKDKSQKVETRDGRKIHNIWQIKEPPYTNNRKAEVCALIDGEDDALVFFEGGRYLPTTQDTDSPFDLFIITPEPELTEFELRLLDWLSSDTCGEIPMDEMKKCVKNRAAELLALARKELEPEVLERLDAAYKNQDEVVYENGKRDGKAEVLKDLPRWRKCADCTPKPKYSNEWIFSIDSENVTRESVIVHKGYFLPLDDLENFPGFNE